MTKNQFRDALAALHLTQMGTAAWLGISIRAVHGYANGMAIPEPTAKLRNLTCLKSDSPARGKLN
jgi:hypothetical protein